MYVIMGILIQQLFGVGKYLSRWKWFGYREISFIQGENLPIGVEHFLGLPQAHPKVHKDKDLNYEVCVN